MEHIEQVVANAIQPLLARISVLEQETTTLRRELEFMRSSHGGRFYRSSRSHFSNGKDAKNQTLYTARSPEPASSQFRTTGGTMTANMVKNPKPTGNGNTQTLTNSHLTTAVPEAPKKALGVKPNNVKSTAALKQPAKSEPPVVIHGGGLGASSAQNKKSQVPAQQPIVGTSQKENQKKVSSVIHVKEIRNTGARVDKIEEPKPVVEQPQVTHAEIPVPVVQATEQEEDRLLDPVPIVLLDPAPIASEEVTAPVVHTEEPRNSLTLQEVHFEPTDEIQLLQEEQPASTNEQWKQQVSMSLSRKMLEQNLLEKNPDYEQGNLGLVSKQSLEPHLIQARKFELHPPELSIQPEVVSFLQGSYMRIAQNCQQ